MPSTFTDDNGTTYDILDTKILQAWGNVAQLVVTVPLLFDGQAVTHFIGVPRVSESAKEIKRLKERIDVYERENNELREKIAEAKDALSYMGEELE